MAHLAALLVVVSCLAGCNLIWFDEYDYKTHKSAHIGIKGVDADVHKVHGGLFLEKTIKFGKPKPCPKKPRKAAKTSE